MDCCPSPRVIVPGWERKSSPGVARVVSGGRAVRLPDTTSYVTSIAPAQESEDESMQLFQFEVKLVARLFAVQKIYIYFLQAANY